MAAGKTPSLKILALSYVTTQSILVTESWDDIAQHHGMHAVNRNKIINGTINIQVVDKNGTLVQGNLNGVGGSNQVQKLRFWGLLMMNPLQVLWS